MSRGRSLRDNEGETAATAESQRLVRDLLLWLRHEHGVDPPGQRLADPATLSAESFLAEVKKRRPKGKASPGPTALAELKRVHEDTRLPLLKLRKQVAESEAALATLVHAAFGLGPEDLDLLRRTQPPRTPPGLG